ncbi:MAG: hypothetical protein QCH31_03900 [Methanolobus sp.]|nr:hypothetical protein [Methanolobus sp.]
MNPETTFFLANIFFTIGTIFLFSKVIKNRQLLKDFDLIGSITTTLALFLILISYINMQIYFTALLAIPTFLFWLFVSIYTIKNSS